MLLNQWLKSLGVLPSIAKQPGCRRIAGRRRRFLRAATVESLESRTLLSATELVSQAVTGAADGGNGLSERPSVSADGRFVAFESEATDLVPGQVDTADTLDVFVFDRQTGFTTLISHTGDGVTAGNGDSDEPIISADGSTVVFRSEATNLVTGFTDNNDDFPDIFAASGGVVTLISHAHDDPTAGGNLQSGSPVLSADGGTIAYESDATNLVSGFVDRNATGDDIFVYAAGTTTLISHAAGSTTIGGNGNSDQPLISADGSRVAFDSQATDLVSGFNNNNGTNPDIFAAPSAGGTISLISRAHTGATDGGNGFSADQTISGDGSVIAFRSRSTDLINGFVDNQSGSNDEIYANSDGTVSLISHAAGNPLASGNDRSDFPVISTDGSTIAFLSDATNLVAGFTDNNGDTGPDIFAHSGGTTSLITAANGSTTSGGNSFAFNPVISADGSTVAFRSSGTNLIAGFVNNNGFGSDIFSRTNGETTLISHSIAGPTAGGEFSSNSAAINADGTIVIFVSDSEDLVAGFTDNNGIADSDGDNNVDIFAHEQRMTFIVDSTGDSGDSNPGDGVADDGTGRVTLRAAIEEANAGSLGVDIEFSDSDVGGAVDFHDATSDAITLGGTQLAISSNIAILGPGADLLTVSGADSSRVFRIADGEHNVTLDSLTIADGRLTSLSVAGNGAALRSESHGTLTLTNTRFTDNDSGFLGGAVSANDGNLFIRDSVFDDNRALSGGAINFVNNSNHSTIESTVVMERTTFNNNSAITTSGGAVHLNAVNARGSINVEIRDSLFSGNSAVHQGGGLFQRASLGGTLHSTIVNSTLSGNSATTGGGIYNEGVTSLAIVNSTIIGNNVDAANQDGGGIFTNTAQVTLQNTIVAGNTIDNTTPDDIRSAVDAANSSNNIIGVAGGGFIDGTNNNQVGVDVSNILATTLADNGGPTLTHALIANSSAINAGDNALAIDPSRGNAALISDQRGTGFDRIIGGTVDIGALESEALAFPPQAPENVIAADTETLRPTISWDAEPNATSYGIWFIKLAEGATPGSVVAGQSGLTSLSFTPDADLVEGNYSVWVRSINAAGASTWSIPATFRIGPMVTIPAAPASVTVVDATFARPTIEWTPSADATSYGIWFINLAGGVVAGESGLTGTSFTPSADLVAGNEYRVYVRAINSAGVGDWSTPLDFRSGPIVATPDAPLAVTVIDTETLRPTIQWDAAATATSYGIWFINLAGGVVAGQSGLTGLSFTPSTDLVAGDEYRVYVRSINSAGPSDWSAPVTFRVGPMETIPGPPQNVTAIDIETAVPTIQWDAVANASSYGIWFVNLAGGVVAGESGLTSTSFTSPTALDGNYRVWIRSFNAAGVSDWSTPLDITVTTVDMELTLEDGPAHGDLQLLEVELLESRNLAGVPEFRGNPNAHPHSHRRTQPPRLGQDQAQPSDRGVRIVERQHESNAAVVEWARRSTAADRANQKADLSHEAEDSDLLFPFLAAANTWSAETTGTM